MENKKQIQINSFEELVQFFEKNKFNDEQKKALVEKSLGIYYDGSCSNDVFIPKLREFWEEYGGLKEKPLFLDGYDPHSKIL